MAYRPFPFSPETNAPKQPCESSEAVASPGSDPVLGSNWIPKAVGGTSGGEVIEPPVGESSHPVALTRSDSVSKGVDTSKANTGGEVTESPVGESSDQLAVPGSHPGLESDPGYRSDLLMLAGEVKGWPSSKQRNQQRIKRASGSWKMGCGFYNIEVAEVAGGLNQTVVGYSKGKLRKRSRKGTKNGKESESLPPGWTIICKTRTRGATAGVIDKYYKDPTTGKRYRSKVAVKRYLETLSSAQPERQRKIRHRDEDEEEEEGSSSELSI